MKIILRVIASKSLLLLASFASRAELVNFEIVEIESPTFDGRSHLGADRLCRCKIEMSGFPLCVVKEFWTKDGLS